MVDKEEKEKEVEEEIDEEKEKMDNEGEVSDKDSGESEEKKDGDDSEEKSGGDSEGGDEKGGEKNSKRRMEFVWVMGVMGGLIIVLVASSLIFQSLNTFEYEGLAFTKEKFGNILLYHYYYYYNYEGEQFQYNLYLRNDPRKNRVPITGDIIYDIGEPTFLSINVTGISGCQESNIAVSMLADFLAGNQLKVETASPDEEVANATNHAYVTCETHPKNLVILLQEGEETEIYKDGKCHVINVANCEVIEAVEKFEVKSLLDARSRAGLD